MTLVLAMLSMVGAWGIDAYLPSFQAIGQSLEATPVLVQQTLSVYMAALATTVLFAGTLSDSLGRRPVVLSAVLLFAFASAWASMAEDIQSLIVARGFQGVAAGVTTVLSRTIVQDLFQGAEAQRVMSLITMLFAIAPSIAPVVGGWLQATLDWPSVFVMLAVYASLLFWLCLRHVPESLPPEKRQPLRFGRVCSNYLQVLRHGRFMAMVLSIGLVFIGIALYVSSAASYVVNVLKLGETDFGWMFIPVTTGMVLGASVARRFARKVAPEHLSRTGQGVMFTACLISVLYTHAFTPTVPWAVLPLGLYAFGLSLALPSMTVATLSLFPTMRGLAASMQSFVQMGIFSLVSAFVAPLVFHSAQALAWAHLVGLTLGIVLWGLAARIKGKPG
ncbi:MAG: multidrug effflux MFS transporter [Lautropia sp.]|nr:multidrug effflux MFS transporter [Lautropia sp.]